MPDLFADAEAVSFGGARVDATDPSLAMKLSAAAKDLPIGGKPVTLVADRRAKTREVSAAVTALGAAGAPTVTIKTEGRAELPKQIVVAFDGAVASPPACAIVATVSKDLSTSVWSVKGSRATVLRKGFAGPDLTRAGDELTRQLASCDAPVAFVSSDDGIVWESTFNLAGTLVKADEKKRVATLVLLHEAPVPGRPLVLSAH